MCRLHVYCIRYDIISIVSRMVKYLHFILEYDIESGCYLKKGVKRTGCKSLTHLLTLT